MLEQLARVLTATSDSFNEISAEVDGDWRRLGSAERKEIGVVYFTPLPYRRKFIRTKQLIDASPNYKESLEIQDYEIFEKVAKDLGVKTMLQGTMSYHRVDVENSLVSAVMSGFLRFTDTEMEDASQKLRSTLKITRLKFLGEDENKYWIDHFFHKKTASEKLISITPLPSEAINADVLTNIKSIERNQFFSKFFKILVKVLGSEESAVITLSAFHKKSIKSKSPRQLIFCLLEDLKIAKNTQPITDRAEQEYKKLKNTISHAKNILDKMGILEIKENSISFKINNKQQLESAQLRDSMFNVEWSHLSSGLRALIDQFCGLRRAMDGIHKSGIKSVVVLIDEGDAYLHLDWQRKYVFLLDKFLMSMKSGLKLRSVHAVLATHSPVIASDFPNELIYRLDADEEHSNKTFAAPIENIIFRSFESNSIGEVAVQKVKKLHKKILQKSATLEDMALVEEIGDVGLKNALLRAITSKEKNDN